ncbi:rRNA small subunit methyltransferase B [Gordonia amarae]|uniref:rRNA small subunit methyltransferase B n=2 Tax=Gordonia amarae TaxID=36821 RepID=A0A857MEH4_9ACTN|nr:transcription antitermination factor NusB [Gordonia amarae]MCS3879216.1 16S rRNA (cytosine967-C5)-methyltransferase [Gordonia amarae]QHN17723.1 rRNA small subunit methyltransferase B [Gordonia amarae]QHN22253.1 rRNA small subunit methyltransferase B [Gordonia amarae]QHN39875.1 rRNA small subunit methyltransferase B [Gordonia amarae]GAB03563.1 putative rRNA methyltransferase [Gordonia amarae NBRC 15530]
MTGAPGNRRPRKGGGDRRGPKDSRPRDQQPRDKKLREKDVDVAREAARDVLRAVREQSAYANLLLPRLLRERHITGRDAAFATELTYGAARAQGLLDAVIASAAGRGIDDIDGNVLDILRLGAYQLLRTRTSPHAAVSTSVDLARSELGMGPSGFVNAVLRKISQRDEDLWIDELAPPMAEDMIGSLAFRYAHPRWIAEVFFDALGRSAGQLQAALAADDERPPVHLVARPGMITAEELALTSGGDEGRYSPYCVYLPGGDPGGIDAVRDGFAGVQDEGSQLVARAVTVAEVGEDSGRWLDMCAGPGGKAALIGAIADIDGARLDALEVSDHRAELIRKITGDLPVDVRVADARDSGLEPGYDRILLDAPCSGLGSLRRRPEARWRRTPADVTELVVLQKELLAEALRLVKPGGVVVYSTCSPHPAETVEVIDAVVAAVPGARQLDARPLVTVGELTESLLGPGPHVQLWPHLHGTDAMFLAAVTRDT